MVSFSIRKIRKNLIKSSLVFFVLLFAISCSDSPNSQQKIDKQKTYNWSLVTTWPKNYPGLGMAPERLAKLVKEMSDGRMNITVYGAGEIVPAMGVFDAVSSGSVQMGHSGAYGTQMFGWFNKEINSLDDLKGLKMRIPGVGGEVFKRAGGNPVNIPGGELYTAMQTGTIDAVEWVGPYNDLAFGFQQVAKYYYYPGWHEPGSMLELLVNDDAWNSLPLDLQAIIETAAKAVNQDLLDEYTASNNKALKELIETHGVELRKLPEEVIMEFKKISDEIIAESLNDETIRKVHTSFQDFLDEVSDYHSIAEDAFVEARSSSD